ncbi:hypothetical protein HWV62_30465 [Athelia sp. TMB]|nr:hypothetical protein HWV62_30465 [Athelia sp. TMB]
MFQDRSVISAGTGQQSAAGRSQDVQPSDLIDDLRGRLSDVMKAFALLDHVEGVDAQRLAFFRKGIAYEFWELSTARAKKLTADVSGALEHLRLALKGHKRFQQQQDVRKQEIEELISSLRPLKKKYDGVVQKRAGSP